MANAENNMNFDPDEFMKQAMDAAMLSVIRRMAPDEESAERICNMVAIFTKRNIPIPTALEIINELAQMEFCCEDDEEFDCTTDYE